MNKKSIEERAQILRCLVEGNSIRGTGRLCGVSKNTAMHELVRAGEACYAYQDEHIANLQNCHRFEVDEIWSFVGAKAKNVPYEKLSTAGDFWVWTAICGDTRLVASWRVDRRTPTAAREFMEDLASRVPHRVQITSDGLPTYRDQVRNAFNNEVDHAMLVKIYGEVFETQRRYSPAPYIGSKKTVIVGNPETKHISTSYAERNNLTMRMGMRRFTRLTNAFSKTVANHINAVSLHFFYYNYCRKHQTLGTTPATKAGISDKVWSLEDVVQMVDWYEEEHLNVA